MKETITGIEGYLKRIERKDKINKWNSTAHKNIYNKRKKNGMCIKCNKKKALKGITNCRRCNEEIKKFNKESYNRKKKMREDGN